jgi:hypothetical protein
MTNESDFDGDFAVELKNFRCDASRGLFESPLRYPLFRGSVAIYPTQIIDND